MSFEIEMGTHAMILYSLLYFNKYVYFWIFYNKFKITFKSQRTFGLNKFRKEGLNWLKTTRNCFLKNIKKNMEAVSATELKQIIVIITVTFYLTIHTLRKCEFTANQSCKI